jgi:chlorophyll/bacteriochlorophyll a synthase
MTNTTTMDKPAEQKHHELDSHKPLPLSILELLKPITWFPPMWAFACGLVSSGLALQQRWLLVAGGIVLTGPLVCGTSQAVNDWFDRHVDAINEPNRPIPSGRIPGRWGLYIAIIWSLLSLLVAAALGRWVLIATVFGLLLAWAYSAPPARLKLNGWFGNAAVGICYEGLPWFTAAAVMAGTLPSLPVIWMALLYSAGAHGIMTLNDFKAIEGDRQLGIRTLPVQLGPERAAEFACWVMLLPQLVVSGLMLHWDRPWHGLAIFIIAFAQWLLMQRLLQDPEKYAPWYNATGITLYVSGMMVAAFAIRYLPA